jgi:Peptidase A4 family
VVSVPSPRVGAVAVLTVGLARSTAIGPDGLRPGAVDSSLNWAGYVAVGRYTSVSASWKVPAVASGHARQDMATFWVGLGGRDSRSLEQIGTAGGFSAGVPRYAVWWEILPLPAVYAPLSLSPGDTVTASVTYLGGDRFTMSLTNTTTGQRFSITRSDPEHRLVSAEAVAEAPTQRGGLLPLSNFGVVRFSDVTVGGRPVGTVPWERVTMTDGSQTNALPSGLGSDGASFSVSWQHP